MTRSRVGDWVRDAACAGMPVAWFFPEPYETSDPRALELCEDCVVRKQCLIYAIRAREPYGIWGGHTAKSRQRLRRRVRKVAA